MQRFIARTHRTIQFLMIVLFTLVSSSGMAIPVTVFPDSLSSEEQMKLLKGEVLVSLSSLQDGVTGVNGAIYIAASPQRVWEVITDYDHHKNFVPNVLDSGTISDNGVEKVMFEKGRSGIFFFQKTVNIKMKVWGELFKRLNFEQITGDFKVYRGEWLLADYPKGLGTFLTYKAQVKPDFFAPQAAVKSVQRRDCPQMLVAMKNRAESLLLIEQKKSNPLP
ncbi:MAG: SRPBCC family protein [Chlorobiaceae bacterium]